MTRKMLSPLFYAVLLIPVFVATIWILSAFENSFGFLFQMNGMIELSIILLTIGTFVFLLGNRGISQFEQLRHPSRMDHFRQSSIHYLIALYCIISLFSIGGTGSLGGAYLFMIAVTSVWAIVINAFYLYRES